MSWNFFDAWNSKRTNNKMIEATPEDVERQSITCKKKYEKWRTCVDYKGFNDAKCREKCLESYYTCVNKLNNMKLYLEESSINSE